MLWLIRAAARLSLRNLHRFGFLLGWLGYALSGTYRRRLDAHAALAGLTVAQRREAVASAGRLVTELPWLWLRPLDQPLGGRVRWQGDERVEAALRGGRGVLLLTPHLGCFEVAAQAVVERFGTQAPLTVMYRPARQAWLRELEETSRHRPGLDTAPAALAGVRQMIRALRRGEMVGVLPDQVPPDGMGVWAPFFGRPAYTMTLAQRLVQQTGAVPLCIWAERLPGGAGFVLRVTPLGQPLPAKEGDDAAWQVACAARINTEMETLIRQCPGQYLWGYHRYKQPRPMPAAEAAGPKA
jgi:KDO2-lipid IV(A) lauroyltransferase